MSKSLHQAVQKKTLKNIKVAFLKLLQMNIITIFLSTKRAKREKAVHQEIESIFAYP